jgi:hypothetical protein
MLLEEQKHFPGNTTMIVENNDHGQYTKMCGLIKTMFEKISTLLFDQETVSKLLKLIFSKVSNGKSKKEKNELFLFRNIFVVYRTRTTSIIL